MAELYRAAGLGFAVVDATELSLRARTYKGWIPTAIADLLIERGHLDVVRRQAEAGDWLCAQHVAKLLPAEDALALLRPYVDTGWWGAADAVSELLEEWGRLDDAVALVRPHAEGGERLAVRRLAELRAAQGRVDEVIALLAPGVEDWYLADALAELAGGGGRDDEVLALLPDPGRECRGRCQDDAGLAGRRAKVLEQHGRVEEAVELLRSFARRDNVMYVNVVDQLADLLARHGRDAELREFVAGDGGDHAAFRLADLLVERGRLDQALEALQPFVEAQWGRNAVWKRAELLKAGDRFDEAIETLRGCADDECILPELCTLLIERGRAADGLAIIDDLAREDGGMSEDVFLWRVRLLAACGRDEEAVAELRAHPEADAWYMADELAELLTEQGRLDEAAEVLEASDRTGMRLAEIRIMQGRIEDAVTLLSEPEPKPVVVPGGWGNKATDPDDPWSTEPPF
ncbi:hypothetical protein [Streptomyces justiciae]|uniref:hypothetical protein n=1 Tax=Streptomyces justiciae TaxID=2780140 RepID=UPI0021199887|nr:hypothetical protein [Streptomyces justiciae]MCW8381874.1 hypothetical protein [Streptomyces justiciae]